MKHLFMVLLEASKNDPLFKKKMIEVIKMGFDLKATYYLDTWLYLGMGQNLKKYSDRIDAIRKTFK